MTPYHHPESRLHRRHDRPRLPEEGARRRAQPARRAAVLRPDRQRHRRRRRWSSSRARRASTTRTSRPTGERYEREWPREAPGPPTSSCRRSSSASASWPGTSCASTCTSGRSASTSGRTATSKAEPQLLDSHMEEVRSGHNEEPEAGTRTPAGARARSGTSGSTSSAQATSRPGVLAIVGPDGFPFAMRARRSSPTAATRLIRLGGDPVGAPLDPGLACLVIHGHAPDFSLAAELPGPRRPRARRRPAGRSRRARSSAASRSRPARPVAQIRVNAKKMRRYHKIAEGRAGAATGGAPSLAVVRRRPRGARRAAARFRLRRRVLSARRSPSARRALRRLRGLLGGGFFRGGLFAVSSAAGSSAAGSSAAGSSAAGSSSAGSSHRSSAAASAPRRGGSSAAASSAAASGSSAGASPPPRSPSRRPPPPQPSSAAPPRPRALASGRCLCAPRRQPAAGAVPARRAARGSAARRARRVDQLAGSSRPVRARGSGPCSARPSR